MGIINAYTQCKQDTVHYRTMTPAEREKNESDLLARLSHIIDKSNFDELNTESFARSISGRGLRDGVKVHVNMSRFKTLRVWVRGELDTTVIKSWNQSLYDKWQVSQ